MSEDECRRWRGSLGARALGLADPPADPAFDAHLDGCRQCRAELDDLGGVVTALSLADGERLDVRAPGRGLEERIMGHIADHVRSSRRQRWRRSAVGAAAAGAVAAILLATLVVSHEGGGQRKEVALAAVGGAAGTVELVGRAWGTEITLQVRGLDRDEVYWLWLSEADGERTVAGTISGTDGTATVVLAAALPLDEARRIWMTDEEDEVVLDAPLEPS